LLLVASSIGNNSWLLISLFSSFDLFFLYILIYSFNFYLVLTSLSPYSSLNYSSSFNSFKDSLFITFLLSLSGMPPFPLFFLKAFIVYSLSFYLPLCVFLRLFFTFIIVSSYIISMFKLISYRYSLFVFNLR
jgi:hypothetical protein